MLLLLLLLLLLFLDKEIGIGCFIVIFKRQD